MSLVTSFSGRFLLLVCRDYLITALSRLFDKRHELVLDRDSYGEYEQCLNCGYLRDLEDRTEINLRRAFTERVIVSVFSDK